MDGQTELKMSKCHEVNMPKVCGVCVGSMLMVGCVYMRGVYIVWDVYAVGML